MIEAFVRQSREWAMIPRGRVLFEQAAALIQDVFKIDSGMFIYKRRTVFRKEDSPGYHVYEPWGLKDENEDSLSALLLDNGERFPTGPYLDYEQWIDVEEVPFPWKKIWQQNNITQVGIWPIIGAGKSRGGMMLGRRRSKEPVDNANELSVCASQISLVLEMLTYRRKAEHASNHDPLTNLFNRRGLENYLLGHSDVIEKGGHVIAVLDVNEFKEINDQFGHKIGDSVLIDIAETLKEQMGERECCARFGGDEYIMIIESHSDLDRLENRIESWFRGKTYSIAVGCALLGEEWEDAFGAADQRLYKNKSKIN